MLNISANQIASCEIKDWNSTINLDEYGMRSFSRQQTKYISIVKIESIRRRKFAAQKY